VVCLGGGGGGGVGGWGGVIERIVAARSVREAWPAQPWVWTHARCEESMCPEQRPQLAAERGWQSFGGSHAGR